MTRISVKQARELGIDLGSRKSQPHWTKEEETFLKENYLNNSVKEIADKLNKSAGSIRTKKMRLRLKASQRWVNGEPIQQNDWTDDDSKRLSEWYKSHDDELSLDQLAGEMGRTVGFLCRKARQLGITKFGRKPSWMKERLTARLKEWNESPEGIEQRTISLKQAIEIIKSNHPKGMLGKTHSKDYRKKIAERAREWHKTATEEQKAQRYERMIQTKIKNGTLNPLKNSKTPYSRSRGGKRKDIGDIYFRSAWEANIARYFNYIGIKWEYEPREFIFEGVRRGCVSYTPDFYLPNEDRWIEVKGWMDKKSKTKLSRFQKYYPEEYEKLEIIDESKYKEFKKWSRLIPGWED